MRTLHVLNGDEARRPLERARVPGELAVWSDLLHEGPLPAEVGTAEARRIRAEYLNAAGYGNREAIAETLGLQDEALARWYDFDELVFWLEHDLFDQLLLLRHLVWLSRSDAAVARARLIVVDGTFGPMSPESMAALVPARSPVTPARVAAATDAWRAVTADDPLATAALVARGPHPELPFVHGALCRLLEDLPGVEGGLSRTERQLLMAITSGSTTLLACFQSVQRMEERVFLGDLPFLNVARRLADSPTPLLTLTSMGGNAPLGWRVDITRFGRTVLAGDADHVRTNGPDRWLGGLHLSGFGPTWRWNGQAPVWA